MKIRVRFGKEGILQYIGHLDVLRTFQKIFRRAGLPMAYSQGFSPHPIMSFALPLGLGLTSEGEYLDSELTEEIPAEEILARLQAATAEELPVYAVTILPPDKSENAMSSVGRALYRLESLEELPEEAQEGIRRAADELLTAPSVVIRKQTKTKEADADIRPMIFRIETDGAQLLLELAAGSAANLKPELAAGTMFERAGLLFERSAWRIRRLDLMRADGRSLSLLEET
ncbi:MAG: DUF2344 domain-containing protein [Oscillospiraceae bacterium]|nr:DUF2344 domain-containing protein [Oscillospiraceae bacterium]